LKNPICPRNKSQKVETDLFFKEKNR